jgi:hypothetical protein
MQGAYIINSILVREWPVMIQFVVNSAWTFYVLQALLRSIVGTHKGRDFRFIGGGFFTLMLVNIIGVGILLTFGRSYAVDFNNEALVVGGLLGIVGYMYSLSANTNRSYY